jgi:phage recombination protein Bet
VSPVAASPGDGVTGAPGGKKPAGKELAAPARPGLMTEFAAQYNMERGMMAATLRSVAFNTGKGEPPASDEELAALVLVAKKYNLNPFLREIYAFRNKRTGGIVPIIGFDGWIRLVQNQDQFDGEELIQGWDDTLLPEQRGESGVIPGEPMGLYYECKMYRKDRRVPTVVREYHRENWRDTDPWRTMPNRMTRMRAYIQCARVCFGFGGIYDDDEGEKIALAPGVDLLPATAKGGTTAPQARQDAPLQLANDEHLEMINEKLGKTGVLENLVLAKFEVGELKEIPAERVADVLKFIQDNAP